MTVENPTPYERLRAPFPPESIGTIPRGGVSLSYVGHAYVTERLLEVDPEWTWEPIGFTEDGLPRVYRRDDQAVLWIRMTVNGVTRVGVGIAHGNKDELEKELISDAIRNAAMRFGVALDLWKKETEGGTGGTGPAPAGGGRGGATRTGRGGQPSSSLISDKQRGFLLKLLDEKELPDDFEVPNVDTLTRREASTLIDTMVGFKDLAKPRRGATVKAALEEEPPPEEYEPF